MTWDQDDPNRIKVLRRPLTKDEIEEEDFRAYLASSSEEDEGEDEIISGVTTEQDLKSAALKRDKRKKAKDKTEQLRQLLLNGGDGTEDVWGKHSGVPADMQDGDQGGEMEITFKAGLSSTVQAKQDEDLTTLERYQRRMKEKKDRKKEKKELKYGSKDAPEGEEKATKAANAEEDDFFGQDEDDEESREKPPHLAMKVSTGKSADKPVATAAKEPVIAVADETKHFSLQDIVKAEKEDGRRKRSRHKKGKYAAEREIHLGDEGFDINVKDDRFKALYEEPAFAIDPSDPQ